MVDPELIPKEDELIAVWRRQLVSRRSLKKWQEEGTVMMTDERFTRQLNEAVQYGYKLGERRGRYNLRQAIENGETPPILKCEVPL